MSKKVDTLFLFFLLLWIAMIVDWRWDERTCAKEFEDVANITPKYNFNPFGDTDVFANDDYLRFNFGKDIDCSVFWTEGKYLTHVDFVSGQLTEEQISTARYWNRFMLLDDSAFNVVVKRNKGRL